MKLTRKILTEKTYPLWRYNHHKDVPESVWVKIFAELSQLQDSEILDYIASKTLSPLCKETNYQISDLLYTQNGNLTYRQIIINNLFIFNVPIELGSNYNYKQFFTRVDISIILRKYILENWDKYE